MKNNKKGVSTVVATVLIILITVAAVTFLWVAINNLISDEITAATHCHKATPDIKVITSQGYTCYDATAGNVQVQIKRGAGVYDLVALQVIISEDGDTVSSVDETTIPGANEEEIYTYALTTAPDAVRVAPIIKFGNQEQYCDSSESFTISVCQ